MTVAIYACRAVRLCALIVVAWLAVDGGDVWAQSARDLKNTGAVGETIHGYLGLVDGAGDSDLKAAVESLNAQRRSAYEKTAGDTGRSMAEVEAVAGARLRERAGSGDWVQNAAGQWIQKP